MTTRAKDDQILEWLRLRDAKHSMRQIGDRYGVTKNTVIGALNRVDRDLEKSEAEE